MRDAGLAPSKHQMVANSREHAAAKLGKVAAGKSGRGEALSDWRIEERPDGQTDSTRALRISLRVMS